MVANKPDMLNASEWKALNKELGHPSWRTVVSLARVIARRISLPGPDVTAAVIRVFRATGAPEPERCRQDVYKRQSQDSVRPMWM